MVGEVGPQSFEPLPLIRTADAELRVLGELDVVLGVSVSGRVGVEGVEHVEGIGAKCVEQSESFTFRAGDHGVADEGGHDLEELVRVVVVGDECGGGEVEAAAEGAESSEAVS